jgi:lia operon protein LiaF
MRPLGDVRRRGEWQVGAEEIWMFVGDVRLDMSQAVIPAGETIIRIFSFVGDVELVVPADVGVSLASTAFLTDCRLWGEKKEQFFGTLERLSPGYEQAERKIRLEALGFVVELKVKRGVEA